MTFTYPPARRGDVVDLHHGREIADPYRWLEDLESDETAEFVAAQNAITAPYLAALPEPETVAQAQHLDHISAALESGHTITIWPMGDVQDTVWVEVDPVAGTYRLASGTGAGNAANETVTLIGLIAGTLMTVLTMNDCSGRGSRSRKHRL